MRRRRAHGRPGPRWTCRSACWPARRRTRLRRHHDAWPEQDAFASPVALLRSDRARDSAVPDVQV